MPFAFAWTYGGAELCSPVLAIRRPFRVERDGIPDLMSRLSYVEVSLFKRERSQVPPTVWSYPTFPQSIQSELFDTDSESDPSQSQQIAGRLKLPKPPGAPEVYVRTRPQRRQHLAGVFCFTVAGIQRLPSTASADSPAGREAARAVV
jgi:hypothetical protein